MHRQTRIRAAFTATALLLPACTGTGVNAGEDGGKAFILFAMMLFATIAILWLILGRED